MDRREFFTGLVATSALGKAVMAMMEKDQLVDPKDVFARKEMRVGDERCVRGSELTCDLAQIRVHGEVAIAVARGVKFQTCSTVVKKTAPDRFEAMPYTQPFVFGTFKTLACPPEVFHHVGDVLKRAVVTIEPSTVNDDATKPSIHYRLLDFVATSVSGAENVDGRSVIRFHDVAFIANALIVFAEGNEPDLGAIFKYPPPNN